MQHRRFLSGPTSRPRGTLPARRSLLTALLALALAGTAIAAPAPPAAPAAAAEGSEAAGSFLRAEDHRLGAIAYRLALNGLRLCTERAPLTGMMLHHLAEYDAEGRRLVLAAWPLAEGPGVLSVIENSPAARSGLAAGDVIIAVNGTPVRSPEAILAMPDAKARL